MTTSPSTSVRRNAHRRTDDRLILLIVMDLVVSGLRSGKPETYNRAQTEGLGARALE
jgi:hypothetical protein